MPQYGRPAPSGSAMSVEKYGRVNLEPGCRITGPVRCVTNFTDRSLRIAQQQPADLGMRTCRGPPQYGVERCS